MERKVLFDAIKEEVLNHTDLGEDEAEEIADAVTERLIEEDIFDKDELPFGD